MSNLKHQIFNLLKSKGYEWTQCNEYEFSDFVSTIRRVIEELTEDNFCNNIEICSDDINPSFFIKGIKGMFIYYNNWENKEDHEIIYNGYD